MKIMPILEAKLYNYQRFQALVYISHKLVTDMWSTGCVMAELMLRQPLFPSKSGID